MTLSNEERTAYITIWSKAIDTQMHFNEMCVKSRQLGLTFVAAALGIGLILLSRGDDFMFSFLIVDVHVSALIVFAAALALYAVSILDLKVYHRMLRGAVTFGEDFEQNYMKKIFDLEKGMTQTISHYSRHSDAGKTTINGKNSYSGTDMKSAEDKIRSFYRRTIFTLGVIGAILAVSTVRLTW